MYGWYPSQTVPAREDLSDRKAPVISSQLARAFVLHWQPWYSNFPLSSCDSNNRIAGVSGSSACRHTVPAARRLQVRGRVAATAEQCLWLRGTPYAEHSLRKALCCVYIH